MQYFFEKKRKEKVARNFARKGIENLFKENNSFPRTFFLYVNEYILYIYV